MKTVPSSVMKEDYALLEYSVRVAKIAALLFKRKHFRINNKILIGR